MLHYFLRLALVPIALFTAVLLLIRAQPYNNHQLRQILLPEGCPAPCFMGIRPGVTTADEAVDLLEASGWITDYEYDPILPLIRVKWNRSSPVWLENDGMYNGAVIWVADGIVDAFMLDTTLPLGELQLVFGPAVFQSVTMNYLEGGSYLFYSANYPQLGVSTTVQGNCDGERKTISYRDNLYLGYSSSTNMFGVRTRYTSSWADVVRTRCG